MVKASALAASRGSFRLGPLDLEIPAGTHGTLLGRSGAGKSTLLRALAGLVPASGEIVLGGVPCAALPPERRPIGWVPQGGGLFPHLRARDNVALVRAPQAPPVDALLERTGASPLADRWPSSLSGGETLRVALARALGRRPTVLLLDEPLAAIDRPGRQPLLGLLAGLARGGTALLHVTHDAEQALSVAGWLGVLDEGRLVAAGAPAALLSAPLPPAARAALGFENLRAGIFEPDEGGLSIFRSGRLELRVAGKLAGEGYASFPSSAVIVSSEARSGTSIRNQLSARVAEIHEEEATAELLLDDGLRATLTLAALRALALRPGAAVVAEVKATAVRPILRLH
ncbi:MAG: ABC transporter ATP-binding protein [Myxococcales bacterium]